VLVGAQFIAPIPLIAPIPQTDALGISGKSGAMNHAPLCDISLHSRVQCMMPYDPDRHARRSIRMRDYDYAQPGAYFVTVCTYQRECLLGDVIADGHALVRLSKYGRIVCEAWFRSADIRPGTALDAFVIMPNHIHGIVIFHVDVGAHSCAPSTKNPGPSEFRKDYRLSSGPLFVGSRILVPLRKTA
jgi:REP element-mobilizing transposase RayT